MRKFPETLKKIMYEKNLTTTHLSKLIGVNKTQIKRWFLEKSKPRLMNVLEISIKLNVSVDVLLGLKED